ncbi:hypothetical protein [Streptomyces sp. NPDC054975]
MAGEPCGLSPVGGIDPDAGRLAVRAELDGPVGAGLLQGGGPDLEREVLELFDLEAVEGPGQEEQHAW